ncbi:Polycystin cation channel-domain-containing protein [Pelagophyceae sp. CCMP2097]|nr:Polycystin cation channel-domain-containing protein [Pelagophyceae sp. CCMP2097]
MLTDKEQAVAAVAQLRKGTWLDRQTRALFVDFSLFQNDVDSITFVRLALTYSPTGQVTPEAKVSHARLRDLAFLFDRAADKGYFAAQFALYAFVLVRLAAVVRAAAYHHADWTYFHDAYNNFEVLNCALFVMALILRCEIWRRFSTAIDNFQNKAGDSAELALETYMDLAPPWHVVIWYRRILAVNALLTMMTLLKYVRGIEGKITLPIDVIGISLKRVASLSIVIGLLLSGYSIAFDLMYGYSVHDYRSFLSSLLTLSKAIFGDLVFDDFMQTNRYLGPALFILYSVVMLVVVLSMFFSMVSNAHNDMVAFLAGRREVVAPELLCDLAHAYAGVVDALAKVPGLAHVVHDSARFKKYANRRFVKARTTAAAAEVEVDDEELEDHDADFDLEEYEEPSEELIERAIQNPKLVVLRALHELQDRQEVLVSKAELAMELSRH